MILILTLLKNRVLSRFVFLISVFFLLFYFGGCGTTSRGPVIQPKESRLAVVRDILTKNYQKFQTLQGRGKLVVQSPWQSFSGNAIVNIKKPDSIYVRVEALLGLDVGLVFADRAHFLIYSPTENCAYIGDNSDTLRLKSFLGFDLTLQEMMQSMSGLAVLKEMTAAKLKWKEDELHIIGIADSIFYDYTIDEQFGLISNIVMKDFQGRILRIEEYKRFAIISDVRIPQMVRFLRPNEKESLTVFYDHLVINKSVPAKSFHVKMPDDALKIRP
ncbi:DUF4292 domain-containing protein [candidate division KSB1 bacterium]|nr:DUF4292 domain-containing protein [candidate division KSB1 bacterium]RQW05384.1 MAG: DUF4292 domain-containing protein [candidate division KSB1 bacterium]